MCRLPRHGPTCTRRTPHSDPVSCATSRSRFGSAETATATARRRALFADLSGASWRREKLDPDHRRKMRITSAFALGPRSGGRRRDCLRHSLSWALESPVGCVRCRPVFADTVPSGDGHAAEDRDEDHQAHRQGNQGHGDGDDPVGAEPCAQAHPVGPKAVHMGEASQSQRPKGTTASFLCAHVSPEMRYGLDDTPEAS